MHDCQQQTMNDSELIKNQKHKPTKPFIAKNYQLDFHIHLVSMSKLKLVIYLNFIDQSKKKQFSSILSLRTLFICKSNVLSCYT